MADDLGDEWWKEPGPGTTLKRKQKQPKSSDTTKVDESSSEAVPRKKKKRKNQNHSEKKDSQDEIHLWQVFSTEMQAKLSHIELEDLMPPADDQWCISQSKDMDFSAFLTEAYPIFQKKVRKFNESLKCSPMVMIVASSAKRAVELNRQSISYKGSLCKTAKLFAKHIKIEDQVHHLKKQPVHFAIGTPNRLLKLFNEGALSTRKLRLVVFDWRWKDQKQRSIMGIPEVKRDILDLLHAVIFPAVRAGMLRVALF